MQHDVVITPINELLLPSFNKTDQFINRGKGSARNSKIQDVCHIAFGSKVLGPPPLSGRRNNMRLSSEVRPRFEELIYTWMAWEQKRPPPLHCEGRKKGKRYMPKSEGLNKFWTEILDFKRPQNCFLFVMSTQLTILNILFFKCVHRT